MKLSIIVPCFNEEEVVREFYSVTKNYVDKDPRIDEYEFIFVDDGSRDATLEILKELRAGDPGVRYVSFSRNFGKEPAIYAGLRNSTGDLIVLMDADLQHPPSLLNKMSELIIDKGYDSVGAIRKNRLGENPIRSFLSRSFYRFINSISKTCIVKNSTDYRMMNRQFVDAVLSLSEYNRFTKGIFNWVGFNNADIEYDNVERTLGDSKWNIWGLFKYSLEGIVSFSTAPLVFASWMGLFCFLTAMILFIVFFIKSIIFKEVVRGFPTIICSIFFLGGVQLFSIGILGQYLSKTYLEVKNRPVYIVKEISEKEKFND